jgi:hypothetical protein
VPHVSRATFYRSCDFYNFSNLACSISVEGNPTLYPWQIFITSIKSDLREAEANTSDKMKVTRCTRLFFLYSCTLFFGIYQLNKHTPSEELPVARSSSSNNNTYTDLDLASVSRDQIQPSHGTAMNRYPEEYTNLKAILEQSPPTPNNDDERKILSFGCSTGEEPLSLAQLYFPSPSVKFLESMLPIKRLAQPVKRHN